MRPARRTSVPRPDSHPRPPWRAGLPIVTPIVAAVLGTLAILVLASGPAVAAERSTGKPVYKWVDDKGNTHYGDAIPPEYSDQDKTVINNQGVPVATIPGRRTPEQLEEAARKRTAEDRARQDQVLARQRDQNLLATYLTVEEIESLRDRRLEILEAQSKVTHQYLDTLRGRLKQLETQAQRYRPYSTDEKAGPMPEHLAEDLVRAVNEIRAQERSVETRKLESARLQEQFARDISRFRELKKLESEYARSAQPRT
jgi:hypothetical protein